MDKCLRIGFGDDIDQSGHRQIMDVGQRRCRKEVDESVDHGVELRVVVPERMVQPLGGLERDAGCPTGRDRRRHRRDLGYRRRLETSTANFEADPVSSAGITVGIAHGRSCGG